MHFSLALLAACISAVVSQSTENPFKLSGQLNPKAGEPFTIQWNPTTQGPVDLTLRSGASSALDKGTPIATSIPNNGKYTFTLPKDTVRGSDYTIQINPAGKTDQANYTPQFVVESSNTVKSQTNSVATTATATTSAKSSMTSSSSKSTSSQTRSTSSSTSASSAAATTMESAPTGAAANNRFNVQGGLAAAFIGAAALL